MNVLKQQAGYRWVICSLIFFATLINYLDRAVISLLKNVLEDDFSWSESDYSAIVISFQVAYAAGMLLNGRIIDRVGSGAGYVIVISGWSIAAICHAFVSSSGGFMIARAGLGLSEAGNFPVAIKVVAEWFPKKERALATGIFNSGSNIGAILAPLTVPFIAATWGWKWAFVITGCTGLIWIIFWLILFDLPDRHKRVSKKELDYIQSDTDGMVGKSANSDGLKGAAYLLSLKSTWGFIIGKFLTDPVWWFYLFWLPAFLKAEYNMEGVAIGLPVAVVYTMSSFGSILGGWLPFKLIGKGWDVPKARKRSMLIYALMTLPVLFSQVTGGVNVWYAVFIIGIAAAAHQAWSANIFTTVSDKFPSNAVASVTGMGGMAGAIGGILVAWIAGKLFDHYKEVNHLQTGYLIMFCICGSAYLLAWLIMHLLDKK